MNRFFAIAVTAGLLAGCGGGGGGGSGGGGSPPSAADFARHFEFCTPNSGGTCRNWAPGAVNAHEAYARLARSHPGELPGQGVRVTVVDTGIHLGHWEFHRERTSEALYSSTAGDAQGSGFSHGTAVASLIGAQRDGGGIRHRLENGDFHGIAWGARLHMLAITLGSGSGSYTPVTLSSLSSYDTGRASLMRSALASQGGPDVVNMSFSYTGLVEKYTEAELRANWGSTISALAQGATPAQDRTLLVQSASNAHGRSCMASTARVGANCVGGNLVASSPSLDPGAMARISELRPHSVAVVSTDRQGRISSFSNRCGIAARWCIAAPGEDMLVAYWGPGGPGDMTPGYEGYYSGRRGTSYAAPIVSGGLAVVMQYFRGQMGNTEVLSRVLGTASQAGAAAPDPVAPGGQCPLHLDTDGDRAACELSSTHGRGLLDLDAATRPVGTLGTGVPGSTASLRATSMRTPAAWGDVAGRMGGAELAAFDRLGAPFWAPLGGLLTRERAAAAPFPRFASEEADPGGVAWPGLAWTPAGSFGPRLAPLRLAWAEEGEGDASALGFSWAARPGRLGRLRTGLVFEQGSFLGGSGEGAFEGSARHGLAFGTFSKSFPLGGAAFGSGGLRLALSSTWASGRLQDDAGMLRDAKGLYSSHRAALEHASSRGGLTRLTVEQPLRAEGGSARFRRPVGRTRGGDRVYRDLKVGLRPDARALTFGLRHERPVGRNARLAVGASHTVDAGHVRGEEETWIGARYRLRF